MKNTIMMAMLLYLLLASPSIVSAGQQAAAVQDTTGKELQPGNPLPADKQLRITSVLIKDSLLPFRKGDVIRVSAKTGLKHYRNKRLINTYKIIPQLAIVTIQPQCNTLPCPPTDLRTYVYYMGFAGRFIDVRNGGLLISEDSYEDAATPTTALRLKWKMAFGVSYK
jgi:hypothetical protein